MPTNDMPTNDNTIIKSPLSLEGEGWGEDETINNTPSPLRERDGVRMNTIIKSPLSLEGEGRGEDETIIKAPSPLRERAGVRMKYSKPLWRI